MLSGCWHCFWFGFAFCIEVRGQRLLLVSRRKETTLPWGESSDINLFSDINKSPDGARSEDEA